MSGHMIAMSSTSRTGKADGTASPLPRRASDVKGTDTSAASLFASLLQVAGGAMQPGLVQDIKPPASSVASGSHVHRGVAPESMTGVRGIQMLTGAATPVSGDRLPTAPIKPRTTGRDGQPGLYDVAPQSVTSTEVTAPQALASGTPSTRSGTWPGFTHAMHSVATSGGSEPEVPAGLSNVPIQLAGAKLHTATAQGRTIAQDAGTTRRHAETSTAVPDAGGQSASRWMPFLTHAVQAGAAQTQDTTAQSGPQGTTATVTYGDPSASTVMAKWIADHGSGGGTLHVRVHPEGMGEIVVSVAKQHTGVQVQVTATNGQTVQWLQQQSASMTDAIRTAGVDVAAFQVVAAHTQSQTGAGAGSQSQDQRRAREELSGNRRMTTGISAIASGSSQSVLEESLTGISMRV